MEIVRWIFFGPAQLVALWPYAGVLIAFLLIGAQIGLSYLKGSLFARGFFREAPLFAGLLWLIFNLYELQINATFAQSLGAGALRMDLIILVPILYVLTVAALLSIRAQLRDRHTGN